MTDWKPIASAPKDGSFLGWRPPYGPIVVRITDWFGSTMVDEENRPIRGITHWMPLPAPPNGEAQVS